MCIAETVGIVGIDLHSSMERLKVHVAVAVPHIDSDLHSSMERLKADALVICPKAVMGFTFQYGEIKRRSL